LAWGLGAENSDAIREQSFGQMHWDGPAANKNQRNGAAKKKKKQKKKKNFLRKGSSALREPRKKERKKKGKKEAPPGKRGFHGPKAAPGRRAAMG